MSNEAIYRALSVRSRRTLRQEQRLQAAQRIEAARTGCSARRKAAARAFMVGAMILLVGLIATAPALATEDDADRNADSAGTVFTFDEALKGAEVGGDLYWAGTSVSGTDLSLGNDLLLASVSADLENTAVEDDIRAAASTLSLKDVSAGGNMTLVGGAVSILGESTARGIYCGGETIEFEGMADFFEAYGSAIYFNGTVDGDVSLSAQDIVIGPDAKVAGTLLVRSGQELDIPATAQIATVDNTLDNPNTIDQLTELRSVIAPYFQIGGFLFILVAGILIGAVLFWINGRQLYEAQRVLRRYPVGHLLMGLLGVLVSAAATIACFALVLTIPIGIVLLLVLIASIILCVPFTGVSLMLMAVGRLRPAACVVIGSAAGALLMFVPYVNVCVALFSLIYFLGYVLRCHFLGHDDIFQVEMESDRAKRTEKEQAGDVAEAAS